MKTPSINPSFIRWTELKPLFASSEKKDFITANDVLERFEVYAHELEDFIEELNLTFKHWHFYLADCCIKRVKAQNEESYAYKV